LPGKFLAGMFISRNKRSALSAATNPCYPEEFCSAVLVEAYRGREIFALRLENLHTLGGCRDSFSKRSIATLPSASVTSKPSELPSLLK